MATVFRTPLVTPLPPGRTVGVNAPVNLLLTTLAVVVAAAPFVPEETAPPRPAPALTRPDVPPNLLGGTLSPPPPAPFAQDDWPTPRPRPFTLAADPPNVLLTARAPLPVPYPFARYDWPTPPPRPFPAVDVLPNLLPAGLAPVPPPGVRCDLPTLRAAPRPLPDGAPNLLTGALAVPFAQRDWPAPRPAAAARPAAPPGLLGTTLAAAQPAAAPFAQADWPTPRPAALVRAALPPDLLTGTLAPVPPGTLLRDTFTDADGTALAAHVMDVGPGWTVYANGTNNYQVTGNRAAATLNDGTNGQADFAAADAGTPDVTLTCTVSANGVGGWGVGVCGRVSDQGNGWFVRNQNTNAFELVEWNAGVATVRATAAMTDGPHTMTVVFAGTSITGYLDGVQKWTFSSSFNRAATKFGIYGGRVNTWRFDDFNVAGPAPFAQYHWPVPGAVPVAPRHGQPPNLLGTTLASQPAAVPFVPADWPAPRWRGLTRTADPQGALLTTASRPAVPFAQYHWPVPPPAPVPRVADAPNLLADILAPTAGPAPFAQRDWPAPRPAPRYVAWLPAPAGAAAAPGPVLPGARLVRAPPAVRDLAGARVVRGVRAPRRVRAAAAPPGSGPV